MLRSQYMTASYFNWAVSEPATQRERELAAKLVGHISKSKKQAQQLDD